MARRSTGRPTKLTPDVHDRIVEAFEAGLTVDDAAAYARVGRSTLLRWLADGADAKGGVKRALYDDVEQAKRLYAGRLEVGILKAGEGYWSEPPPGTSVEASEDDDGTPRVQVVHRPKYVRGDWRALAWLAERKYPERYAKVEQVNVEHGGRVEFDGLSGASDEFVARMGEAILDEIERNRAKAEADADAALEAQVGTTEG